MKKTYKAPLTEVVKLNVGEMLQAVSGFSDTVNTSETKVSAGNALGKDDFDDFDEDLW